MKLFSPDIFSVSKISYKDVSPATRSRVEDLLSERYSSLKLELEDVRQLSALEINSNNFSLNTKIGQRLLLKRIAVSTDLVSLEAQYRSSEVLRLANVPMPEVMADDSGALVAVDGNLDRWTLTRFVEGSYYSGEVESLMEVGSALGRSMRTLDDENSRQLPLNAAVGGLAAFDKSFNLLSSCKKDWERYFPEDILYLICEHESILRSIGQMIVDGLWQLSELPLAAGHTDLHPHNVLVRNGRLAAFVDVDAMQRNIRVVTIAFAMYKLLRQHAVSKKYSFVNASQIKATARALLDSLGNFVAISENEVNCLRFAALFEIYRRILIISDLNIIQRNPVWNKVLPMHLVALYEIPIIFE